VERLRIEGGVTVAMATDPVCGRHIESEEAEDAPDLVTAAIAELVEAVRTGA
jgi:hypothetical protein